MALDFREMDRIPRFTGTESPKEQIAQIIHFLDGLCGELKFLLQNIDTDNMKKTTWVYVDSIGKMVLTKDSEEGGST